MPTEFHVEGRMLGQQRDLFPAFSVPLPEISEAGGGFFALHSLIAAVVERQVDSYNERQEARRFVTMLTQAQIESAAANGKVDMGGRDPAAAADPAQAVQTALQAFEDGLYIVFVDGEQIEVLDVPLALDADSRVTFVRLVALAGG